MMTEMEMLQQLGSRAGGEWNDSVAIEAAFDCESLEKFTALRLS
jgi:hypothetical protein